MKTLFASILFCLLLLPGVGSGQSSKDYNIDGFYLSASGNKDIGFYKQFAPSVYSTFSYRRRQIIKEKRVRKVTVCYGNHQSFWYAVCFDTLGRKIRQIRKSYSGYDLVSDSVFANGKIIVLNKIFSQKRPSAINDYRQFHENDSSNLLVSLDSVIYTFDTSLQICIKKTYSFKMGSLINKRNQYYNDLKLNNPDLKALTVFKYFESGLIEFQRFGEYANRHFVKQIPASYKYMYQHPNYKFPIRFQTTQLKTNYKPNKFYNSSIKKEYIYKINHPEKTKPLQSVYKNKIEGEDFKESDFIFPRESGGAFCRSRGRIIHRGHEVTYDFFSRQIEHKNERGFTDTLFDHSYYDTPQHPNQPCVKPLDDVDFYLDGISGIPKKHLLLTFRYEYFDE